MQNIDEAYLKMAGTWNFNLVGRRGSDNASCAVDARLTVTQYSHSILDYCGHCKG